jgi:hypothetical protein
MTFLGTLFLAGALGCSTSQDDWTDVTAVADPVLTALAEDYAAVALSRKRTDFTYTNTSLRGNKLMVLLLYFENGRPHQFTVLIDQRTWERSHDPSE